MNIEKGMEFIVHWKGHEQSYTGKVYKIVSILRNCTCADPCCFINGLPESPRKPHLHIRADMIKCPFETDVKKGFIFGGIDEETLIDIDDSSYRIEIINNKGIQLSLF